MFSTGNKFYDSFRKERGKSIDTLFHSSIKQNKYVSFSKSSASVTIESNDRKTKVVKVNISILSALNSYSLKPGVPVNYREALEFPLCPIPLSNKKQIKIMSHGWYYTDNKDNSLPYGTLLVDTMALINLITKILYTYFELAKKINTLIPKNFKQVDIIADNYKESKNQSKKGR